jgi:hypothetical protein
MYKREQDLQRNFERASERANGQTSAIFGPWIALHQKINGKHKTQVLSKYSLFTHVLGGRKKEKEEAGFYPQLQQLQQAPPPPKKWSYNTRTKAKEKQNLETVIRTTLTQEE